MTGWCQYVASAQNPTEKGSGPKGDVWWARRLGQVKSLSGRNKSQCCEMMHPSWLSQVCSLDRGKCSLERWSLISPTDRLMDSAGWDPDMPPARHAPVRAAGPITHSWPKQPDPSPKSVKPSSPRPAMFCSLDLTITSLCLTHLSVSVSLSS